MADIRELFTRQAVVAGNTDATIVQKAGAGYFLAPPEGACVCFGYTVGHRS